MNPLHNALAAATERLEALAGSKQDAASALRMTDVDMAVARAIEHADRRGDNLIKVRRVLVGAQGCMRGLYRQHLRCRTILLRGRASHLDTTSNLRPSHPLWIRSASTSAIVIRP